MDTGYEMEPERVGRTRSRRVPALVGTAVLVLAVVIAKPWANAQPAPAKPVPDLLAVTAASPHATAEDTSDDRPGVHAGRRSDLAGASPDR